MNRGKGLGKSIRVGEEGAVKFGFDDFRDCRDVDCHYGRHTRERLGWCEGL